MTMKTDETRLAVGEAAIGILENKSSHMVLNPAENSTVNLKTQSAVQIDKQLLSEHPASFNSLI